MTDADMLTMLKTDLGITAEAYDARLSQYIKAAKAEVEREGVTLTDSVEDAHGVVMYAGWLWRRRDGMEGMPRMLRYWLHNRVTDERMGG